LIIALSPASKELPCSGATKKKDDNMAKNKRRIKYYYGLQIMMIEDMVLSAGNFIFPN
jgi:hypothetical protein